MGKKRENSFDADKFLDSYEEKVAVPAENSPTRRDGPPERVNPIPCDDDREAEYVNKFLIPNTFTAVNRNGKQVVIREELMIKIRRLQVFLSGGGAVAAYVNNVLEEHFREYDGVIRKMFDKIKNI